MNTVTLKVDGMTCAHCVKAVTTAIQAQDPRARVQVDLGAGTVRADTSLPRDVVSAAVDSAGYAVKG
jgi:copper chaperone